ncbi:Uncharacterised protein [Collinsella intestinalis]|nr:Uncharacterised protein [Collinsella intestinalis]
MRRHRRRRGCRPWIHPADVRAVRAALLPRGLRLHGACGVCHGPRLPSLRPVGQVVHSHARIHGLRRSRCTRHQDDREREGSSYDGHDHHVHSLWRQAPGHCAGHGRADRRCRGKPDRPAVLLPRCVRGHRLGHHAQEDPPVRRPSHAVRDGASRLPHAVSVQLVVACVGARGRLHQEGVHHYLRLDHRRVVPVQLWRVRGLLRLPAVHGGHTFGVHRLLAARDCRRCRELDVCAVGL